MVLRMKKRSSTRKPRSLAKRALGYRRRRYIPRMRRAKASNYATCSESIIFTVSNGGAPTSTFSTGLKGTTFPVWYNTDIQLVDFARAPAIAANYQQYRIKYFELRIQPDFDTFIVGGAGAQGVPYLYYMIDKGNAINLSTTNQQLKSMGAKPVRLDDKTIVIRWKPAVLLSTQILTSTGATSAQRYNVSPWLNCDEVTAAGGTFNPSQVCHYGIKFFGENIGGSMSFSATLTAHFEFKKPLLTGGMGVEEV